MLKPGQRSGQVKKTLSGLIVFMKITCKMQGRYDIFHVIIPQACLGGMVVLPVSKQEKMQLV
jgi:hypothetical protein